MLRNISLINPGFGNIGSLQNAFRYLGYNIEIVDRFEGNFSDIVLLPGVGSFSVMAEFSQKRQLGNYLDAHRKSGGLLIGICLGMQFLYSGSDEGDGAGLGLLTGKVKSIRESFASARVPSMGWKTVNVTERGKRMLGGCLPVDQRYYFTHSYYASETCSEEVLAIYCLDDFPIPAIVGRENVLGFQFHPEKSNKAGLDLLSRVLKNYGI